MTLADGVPWTVSLPASLSVILDEVLARGITPDQLLRDVRRSESRNPSDGESVLLARLLVGLDEQWQDGIAELATFRAFCRDHVRGTGDRQEIRNEGERRKAAQRMIWLGE